MHDTNLRLIILLCKFFNQKGVSKNISEAERTVGETWQVLNLDFQ